MQNLEPETNIETRQIQAIEAGQIALTTPSPEILDSLEITARSINETMSSAENSFDERYSKSVTEILEAFSELPDDKIIIGPSFEIESPKGKLTVEVVGFKRKEIGENIEIVSASETEDIYSELYLLHVKDANGKIIAYREFQFYPRMDLVKGLIAVGVKKKGLASLLDLCFIQLTQLIANREGKNIRWVVSNQNLKDLREYIYILNVKKRYRAANHAIDLNELDEDERKTYTNLIEEQKRWQSLYGTSGKLGLKEHGPRSGVMEFSPSSEPNHPFESFDTLSLRRRDLPNGQITGDITGVRTVVDADQARRTKLEEFKKSMTSTLSETKN